MSLCSPFQPSKSSLVFINPSVFSQSFSVEGKVREQDLGAQLSAVAQHLVCCHIVIDTHFLCVTYEMKERPMLLKATV